MDGARYKFLGLSVGVILNNTMTQNEKVYACDVTYGTKMIRL
jgi:preprotein translocase subunit SecA